MIHQQQQNTKYPGRGDIKTP